MKNSKKLIEQNPNPRYIYIYMIKRNTAKQSRGREDHQAAQTTFDPLLRSWMRCKHRRHW